MTEEEQVRALLERSQEAWENRDVETLIEIGEGAGFGWRARDARLPLKSSPETRAALDAGLRTVGYARIVDVQADVNVDGDTAILWGFFTEEFQRIGGQPQVVRVRFTRVARKNAGHWTYVWGHRDAQ